MITASYVSPDMAACHEEAKAKGLVFLNEVGVDPGIDHMATMKIVDEVAEKGGKSVATQKTESNVFLLESWSSTLTAEVFQALRTAIILWGIDPSSDSALPMISLSYKFSWSPIGATRALTNSAKFLKGGKV